MNRSRNWIVMAIYSLRGCVSPLGTSWEVRESFWVHLIQKWRELVKKWSSYGHFLNERLRESNGTRVNPFGLGNKALAFVSL